MSFCMKIVEIKGREILDSRGNPTVETEVTVESEIAGQKIMARESVPSGASTGQFEAVEMRDKDERYQGKGVQQVVENINQKIAPKLIGRNVFDQMEIDQTMLLLDGTTNKAALGANAILSVSLACAASAAKGLKMSLFRYIGGLPARTLPVPMLNIINGGAHSRNSLDFQEFMILPVGAGSFKEALRMGTEVYHTLAKVLNERGLSTAVGDEGGFAPDVDGVEEVLDILVESVKKSGYECGKDICFALDVAASEWKSENGKGYYHLPKSKKDYKNEELIDFYKNLTEKYPIISIEDPLDEEDWEGWKKLTKEIGNRVQLVGDDLFVTNTKRLQKGIEDGCANSILIKVNQIGTLSETIAAIQMAHHAGYTSIVSHRSGETESTVIADLAVAMNSGQIKTGAPCRSERVAKYNQLLRIEEELGDMAKYAGWEAFRQKRNE